MKPDPREELSKLQTFFDEKKRPLIEAVAELERQEAERKAAEAEKLLAKRREEAAEIAKYIVTQVSPKADKLLKELVAVLIKRRDLARDIAARFSDIERIGNQFEHSRNHETACADLLAIWHRRKPNTRHESYTDLDARALSRLYVARAA